LLTLTALFWSGNSVIGRALHEAVPPVTLAFWRWCIALAILLPWIAGPLARNRRVLAANWRVMLLLSILGVATYNTMLYAALHTTTATNSALINSACTLIPVFGTLLAVVFLRESLQAFHFAGAALICAGIYLASARY
jgi:drug/metabolite transporter (DMT)-like permease